MKIILLLLPLLVSCAVVPATRISYDPLTRSLSIRSPKDVSIGSFSVTASNGVFFLSVSNYASKNNVEVINAIAAQNIQAAKALAEVGAATLATAIHAAK